MEADRIRVYPANREQMENSILAEKDDELKKAYGEMLDGVNENATALCKLLQDRIAV